MTEQQSQGSRLFREFHNGISLGDLIGKSVIIVANLKPAKLCGEMSYGMLLAGDTEDGGVQVAFIDGIEPGTKIKIMYSNIFDTHSHDDKQFNADRSTLLKSVKQNGVCSIVSCGCVI